MGGTLKGTDDTILQWFENILQQHFDRATDLGYAAYVSQLLRSDVVVTDDNGGGYVYDKHSATWVKRPAVFLIAEVTRALAKPFNLVYHIWDKYYPGKETESKEGKAFAKTISAAWKSVNSNNNSKNVFAQACAALGRRKNELLQELDASADSLPIMGNKVVCMRSNPPTVRDRVKTDYWSAWLPVRYQQQDDYPNAQSFVRSIIVDDDDTEKEDYSMETRLQMMGGYWLTGETAERKLFNLTGAGRNGKTAFCSLFQAMLGSFYCVGHEDLFLSNGRGSAGGAEPHKAVLRGKRLVVLAETGADDELNMKSIKELVDNNDGIISARDLYEKGAGAAFKLTSKLVVCSNPPIKYKVVAGDDAPGERLDITPFPIKFDPPGENKALPNHRPTDTGFVDSLRNEHLSELFSYFVDGASKWYEKKQLPTKEKVQAATQKNIALNDTMTGFITSELVFDSNSQLSPQALTQAYFQWCTASERAALSKELFLKEISRKLQRKRVGKSKVTVYSGARLKTEHEKECDEED
jgi:phage/plasmid-associated DNA primase